MNILISSCLIGIHCRYNGTGVADTETIQTLMKKHTLIPVCPEQLGGLCTPRSPVELLEGNAVTENQVDVTSEFRTGAEEVLHIAKFYNCKCAILKERSPSCGSSWIYDGSFTGKTIPGQGITTQILRNAGIKVLSENEIEEVFIGCKDI